LTVRGLPIAHLIETDGPGGAETVVVQMATALQAAGARNVVFLPAHGEGWLARQLEGSGVAIEYFHVDRPVSAACARSLLQAFRRHQIAIAHSHEFSMAVYGGWVSWRHQVPHIITMHGGRYYADRLRRRLALRAAIAMSAGTVAVSAPLTLALGSDLRLPAGRVLTIPNGVHHVPSGRTTLREELHLGADDRLLVAVGNLYPVKGHLKLIDALALLADAHPTLHLAIGGRGELHDALVARAREHHLGGRVHLLGFRSDVAAILAAADIFVLPSLSEGLPLALLEAMFAGCPIVATDVGEVRAALARGSAGVVVEPANSRALASAIDGLLRHPQEARRLGRCAAAHARDEYELSRMVNRYVNLYERALARRPDAIAGLSTSLSTLPGVRKRLWLPALAGRPRTFRLPLDSARGTPSNAEG
jgi:glycosyltransferase involved in cell wall biosynthesis